MAKLKFPMTSRQCEIAAESYTACLLAQSGYDVLVQYGANQPHYDLMAVKGEQRKLPISVKGSQDGGWMLAVGYKNPRVTYLEAIREWLSAQRQDVVYALVGFLNVPLGQAPRVYIARPQDIATQLSAQCSGRGHCALQENSPTYYPRAKIRTRFRMGGSIPLSALTLSNRRDFANSDSMSITTEIAPSWMNAPN